jgi:antibiotic biosynthesis monooxygenase (ABM) superfamily enzyme
MAAATHMMIVSLWIHPGQEAAFEAFERAAAAIMTRHGGRIEQAVRVAPGEEGAPYEVHLVSFPDAAAHAAYKSDPATVALAWERQGVILRTTVVKGAPAGPYSADPT